MELAFIVSSIEHDWPRSRSDRKRHVILEVPGEKFPNPVVLSEQLMMVKVKVKVYVVGGAYQSPLR